MEKVRLSKIMSERGLCSRREADSWIAKGWVFVDGQQVKELGTKVSAQAVIEISAHAQSEQRGLVTVLLNKPVGVVSAQPEKDYRPAIELLTRENYDGQGEPRVPHPRALKNLAVAGRLDIDSQGLLVFTQDGRIAKLLIGPDSTIEKEYLVRIGAPARVEQLHQLRDGQLMLDGRRLKKAKVEVLNENQLRFILIEGRKRQIRRMCELVGLEVRGLKRVRIGRVRLGSLPEGSWRFLKAGERF
ncbi:MAG: pseudouridylate synthase [Bdellovibrio sp.]|nr:MAG: pseudouridylate synthase [Bdellovibrio sp.]